MTRLWNAGRRGGAENRRRCHAAVGEARPEHHDARRHDHPIRCRYPGAAQHMLYGDVHRLFVVDGGRPVGVVSTSDIVRAVATGKLG
jgi:CBS domain-containing protein